MDAPLIAINGSYEPGESPSLRLRLRYAQAVLRAGGIPLAIPPTGGPGDLVRLLDRVDGVLLSGGDDFTTEALGLGPTHAEARPVALEKQEFDVELARQTIEREVPVFGVCYGMQLLALVEGARLHQHLPEDLPGAQEHRGGVRHSVRVRPGTKLARWLRVGEFAVVSNHHQALSAVAPPWAVAAEDGEGLVEAVERAEHPFALGVQWHPELSEEGSACSRLFGALVAAAGLRAARRSVAAPSLSGT